MDLLNWNSFTRLFYCWWINSSHFSLKSCLGLNKLFCSMFIDSEMSSLSKWAGLNMVTLWILDFSLISKTFCLKKSKHLIFPEFHLMKVWTKYCKSSKWMCRLDIGMKLPSWSIHNFLTLSFWGGQMFPTL